MKEALLYKQIKDNFVQCRLCSHFCMIKTGKKGKCGVRVNKDGKLYSLVYGKPVSLAVDPIEKKPLYHFLQKTKTYSIATQGCNFSCLFCQNFEISQEKDIMTSDTVTPEEIVESAIEKGCKSISYTYTEPTVFMEYALDIMRIASRKGLKNIWVTNGFMSKECFDMISEFLDAANVDLKSFSDEFYDKVCGAKIQPVLDTIKRIHKAGIHLEITTLIIEGKNDSVPELKNIAKFISGIDKNIPWHISRAFPMYKMQNINPTPLTTLTLAKKIGKEAGLRYIYIGNV